MGFLEICYHVIYSHLPIFTILDEMSLADKRMNLQYFRSDPADIWIWINPEVWIRIPDHILTLAGMGKG